jgi:hypothetical protein
LCPFCPHICPFFNSPPLFSHARGIFALPAISMLQRKPHKRKTATLQMAAGNEGVVGCARSSAVMINAAPNSATEHVGHRQRAKSFYPQSQSRTPSLFR